MHVARPDPYGLYTLLRPPFGRPLCHLHLNGYPMKRITIIFMALFVLPVWAEQYEDVVTAMVNDISVPIQRRAGSVIAVLDFADLQGRTTEFGRFISEEMSTAIVMQSGGINVIDRANLKRILAENKLQVSGLVEPENIRRLGKIIGASALVIGTYAQLGDNIRLTAKVITTDTAQIVAASKGTMTLTDDIRGLLMSQIFDDGAAEVATNSAGSAPSQPPNERLIQEGPGYTASLASAVYFPAKRLLSVQVEYKNEDEQSHCLGLSATRSPTIITSAGNELGFEKALGLKLVRENDKAVAFEYDNASLVWTSVRDFTVVPPGATQRLILIFQANDLQSTTKLDVSINLLRGHPEPSLNPSYSYLPTGLPSGCNQERHSIPSMVLMFNSIAPTI